jgi:hypothetical protein
VADPQPIFQESSVQPGSGTVERVYVIIYLTDFFILKQKEKVKKLKIIYVVFVGISCLPCVSKWEVIFRHILSENMRIHITFGVGGKVKLGKFSLNR